MFCWGLLVAALAAAAAFVTVVASADGAVASGPVGRNFDGWCQAPATAAWRRVLARHVVPLSRTLSLQSFALAPRGRSFFADVRSPDFSGVARIGTPATAIIRIRAFPESNRDAAGGSFDGRWLVWKEYHGFTSFDDFTVYVWDSRTGKVARIGRATRGPDGQFWESPWQGPEVRNGVATWAQGSGPDGLTDVHVYDLRTGQDRVIHTGHASGPFLLAGGLVAWPESPAAGAYTKMYVASVKSGQIVATPPALASLSGISGLATDGRQIAYPDANYKSLWWSPSLQQPPQEILATRYTHYVDNSVAIAGRYISFGSQPNLYIADTRTHRYVEIEHAYGWTELNGAALLVDYGNNTKKTLNYRGHLVLIPLRDLPESPPARR